MVQRFLPLLRASEHPRIVNVSSEAASLASMGGGTPAYTASKVALNALTRMLAAELRVDHVLAFMRKAQPPRCDIVAVRHTGCGRSRVPWSQVTHPQPGVRRRPPPRCAPPPISPAPALNP